MLKNLYDIGAVWFITLTANLGIPLFMVNEIATAISILLAIAFTIYRFYNEWKKNKKNDK